MRFGSTAKVLATCMLKYYRISEGSINHMALVQKTRSPGHTLATPAKPSQPGSLQLEIPHQFGMYICNTAWLGRQWEPLKVPDLAAKGGDLRACGLRHRSQLVCQPHLRDCGKQPRRSVQS